MTVEVAYPMLVVLGLLIGLIIIAAAISALVFSPWLIPAIRRIHRVRRNHCPHCNYDLCGTPSGCPECGWNRAVS